MLTPKWQPSKAVIEHKELAEKWALRTRVPAALILAVIHQESGGRSGAVRPEKLYLRRYGSTPKFINIIKATGLKPEQIATSYGLMQLMLPLAWGYMSPEDKGPGAILALLDADKNIRYGTAHLAILMSNYMIQELDSVAVTRIAGAYNGGGILSLYAKNVAALWGQYDAWLKEAK